MFKPLDIFVSGFVIAALAFALLLDWGPLTAFSTGDVWGLATFVALAVLSQAMAVDSIVGASKPVKSSIAFLPLLALAVVFPPIAVVIAAGGMSAVNELIIRRDKVWTRGLFNIAQIVLSYGLAGWIFHRLYTGTFAGTTGLFDGGLGSVFVPFYALAIIFFALNLLFVAAYIAIRDKQPYLRILQETAGSGGGNLFYDLLASPIALFAAYLYVNLEIAGLLAVVLPLLLVRHSYLSAIQLEKANRDLLQVLIKAIETRDPYTSGHSLRVSTLARMIAEDHGLRASAISDIENAALLHDIGKIDAAYSDIIAKDSTLSDDELRIIKTHAATGADLLQSLTSLDRQIVIGVRHHHERYDGTGYPDRIAGKSIPLAARIIMLCDSIDAMLSDRPYRAALSVQHVRAELVRCSGSQFDPDLVRTILDNNTLERAALLADRSGARTPVRVAG